MNKLSKRDLLKLRLISERGMFIPGKGQHCICPICKQPILGEADLHEAIITRGQVAGTARAKADEIFSQYNCVLRHNVCPTGASHTPGIGSNTDFKNCLEQIVEFEGYSALLEWLDKMTAIYPVVAAQACKRVVSALTVWKGED